MTGVKKACVFMQVRGTGVGHMIQRNILFSLIRQAYPDVEITAVIAGTEATRHADLLDRLTTADDVMRCPEPFDTDVDRWLAFMDELVDRDFDLCVVDPDSVCLDAGHGYQADIPIRIAMPQGRRSDRYITHPAGLVPGLREAGNGDLYGLACSFAAALGLRRPNRDEVVPRLAAPAAPPSVLDEPPPRVAVGPGGQGVWNRRWPLTRYVELCERVVQTYGASLYLMGVPVDASELRLVRDQVRERYPDASVVIDTESSLSEAAGLLSAVDLLIGNDSGLAHIAAFVGTPTVVIYGPSATTVTWADVYTKHVGVFAEPACQITHTLVRAAPRGRRWVGAKAVLDDVDTVERAITCTLGCVTEYVDSSGPYPACLERIEVVDVWGAVSQQLAPFERRR